MSKGAFRYLYMFQSITKIAWLLDGLGSLALLIATFLLGCTFVATALATIGKLFAGFFPVLAVAVVSLLSARGCEIVAIVQNASPQPYSSPYQRDTSQSGQDHSKAA